MEGMCGGSVYMGVYVCVEGMCVVYVSGMCVVCVRYACVACV